MALFQKSVINKYIKAESWSIIEEKYSVFAKYFSNPQIQQNIRNSKEEQFQEGFLRELFVNVFGYTLNPEPDFNLTTELKNIANSKKTDGAILRNESAIAVIELKSTSTVDLSSIESQAFGYKNNHPSCVYVITSNFEKLRFYINNAVEYLEFNLFDMPIEKFQLLYLCLAQRNIFDDVPLKMKQASIMQEEDVTKKLYKDYSAFRNELFRNLVEKNSGDEANNTLPNETEDSEVIDNSNFSGKFDKLTLFKKTQKLLDRFLFIFFAEDRQLLPPNYISSIIKQWDTLKDLDEYVPLYDRFKKHFGYLNTGFRNKQIEVFPYNGGLFAPDELLDNIEIDDDLLYRHTLNLSKYDFETEIDVNILGHIFENSLTEIESVQAELRGEAIDKQKTKRKKDGIFYTPKYITKYIVDNTLGKLCEEQRQQFRIIDEEYHENTKKDEKRQLLERLDAYREWLLGVKILDPACGSGAFLIQALEFLIEEHRKLDELKTKLLGGDIVFSDIENQILENNIFGVDLNEESVEIAKLSLWLRTAQRQRKLNSLTNNIKCGNSLIDDPTIAGDKAFSWEKEFPEIMNAGGFDIIIGNPPYGARLTTSFEEKRYLEKLFNLGSTDNAILFLKKSFDVLKHDGLMSMIIPKSFSFASNYKQIRDYLINYLVNIVDCRKVWKEVLLEQVIISLDKKSITNSYSALKLIGNEILHIDTINKGNVNKFGFILNDISNIEISIALKMLNNAYMLNEISDNIPGVPNQKYISPESRDYDMIGGAEISRDGIKGVKGKIDKKWVNDKGAFIVANSVLVQNIIAHIENPTDHIKIIACIPNNESINTITLANTINQIIIKDEFLSVYNNRLIWILLNSKIINWYAYRFIFGKAIRTMHFYNPVTERIPIPAIPLEAQAPFIEKADIMLEKNKELMEKRNKFFKYFVGQYGIDKPSTKLKEWHKLNFEDFTKELAKLKIKLSATEKFDLMPLFEREQSAIKEIEAIINRTDAEIDRMVYQLYELTEEEIKIVEN